LDVAILSIAIDTIDKRATAALMTPRTCKAARVLLALGQLELAQRAGVALQTLRNFENEESKPTHETWLKIKRALEKAGVQFIDEDGGGAGVRLKRLTAEEAPAPKRGKGK
jgi:DNA-binding XRE family transcriptional regulator